MQLLFNEFKKRVTKVSHKAIDQARHFPRKLEKCNVIPKTLLSRSNVVTFQLNEFLLA